MESETPQEEKDRRRRVKWISVASAAVLLFALVFVLLPSENDLKQYKDELRAKGEKLTFEDWFPVHPDPVVVDSSGLYHVSTGFNFAIAVTWDTRAMRRLTEDSAIPLLRAAVPS